VAYAAGMLTARNALRRKLRCCRRHKRFVYSGAAGVILHGMNWLTGVCARRQGRLSLGGGGPCHSARKGEQYDRGEQFLRYDPACHHSISLTGPEANRQ